MSRTPPPVTIPFKTRLEGTLKQLEAEHAQGVFCWQNTIADIRNLLDTLDNEEGDNNKCVDSAQRPNDDDEDGDEDEDDDDEGEEETDEERESRWAEVRRDD